MTIALLAVVGIPRTGEVSTRLRSSSLHLSDYSILLDYQKTSREVLKICKGSKYEGDLPGTPEGFYFLSVLSKAVSGLLRLFVLFLS